MREYGYEELHWLAHEVKALIPLDPELVADMYVAAFDWTETDESTTPLSHSQIVPMVSNKRQDFQQTRWHLSQHYPKFVERSPFAAARAMIAVVERALQRQGHRNQKMEQRVPETQHSRGSGRRRC